MMLNEVESLDLGDWVLRVRQPAGEGPHPLILLLHGWTGDENAMWVFAPRLPGDALLIAPRALHSTPMGGYAWHPYRENRKWATIEDFRPAVGEVLGLVDKLQEQFTIATPAGGSPLVSMVGFSQGAALSYTTALLHPERVKTVAGLAGFVPDQAEELTAARPLEGKEIFVTHGSQDQIVPIERARQSVELLEQAGAHVTYCEDDVGHKLSLHCFRGLQSFFSQA